MPSDSERGENLDSADGTLGFPSSVGVLLRRANRRKELQSQESRLKTQT